MSQSLDELIAEADRIIAEPDEHVFQPLIMLKLMTAMAREFQELTRARY